MVLEAEGNKNAVDDPVPAEGHTGHTDGAAGGSTVPVPDFGMMLIIPFGSR